MPRTFFFISFVVASVVCGKIPVRIQNELNDQLDELVANSFIEANKAFDDLINAVNKTNFDVSGSLRGARGKLRNEVKSFPFQTLEHSIEIEQVIEKVKNLEKESIEKIETSIGNFYEKSGNTSPADEAIMRLQEVAEEFKTIIKQVDYNCSVRIYPQIVPYLMKYTREMVKSPELLIEFLSDYYSEANAAKEKHVEASTNLRKTLKKCATTENSKRQDCIDQFMIKFVNCRGCDFYRNFLVQDEVVKAVSAISKSYFSYKSPNKTIKMLTSINLKTHLKSCVR